MPPDPSIPVIERIRALLERQGHGSKVRLSNHMGVNKSQISQWISEPPYRNPSKKNEAKLEQYVEENE
jgi:hypothetical protein